MYWLARHKCERLHTKQQHDPCTLNVEDQSKFVPQAKRGPVPWEHVWPSSQYPHCSVHTSSWRLVHHFECNVSLHDSLYNSSYVLNLPWFSSNDMWNINKWRILLHLICSSKFSNSARPRLRPSWLGSSPHLRYEYRHCYHAVLVDLNPNWSVACSSQTQKHRQQLALQNVQKNKVIKWSYVLKLEAL